MLVKLYLFHLQQKAEKCNLFVLRGHRTHFGEPSRLRQGEGGQGLAGCLTTPLFAALFPARLQGSAIYPLSDGMEIQGTIPGRK